MFGAIEFEEIKGLDTMPQDVATAWAGAESGWVGTKIKPISFLGRQVSKGVNYWFFAQEETQTKTPEKKFVFCAINGFNGRYAFIPSSFSTAELSI